MFEFNIKTDGKVKIINVTEARGNFASILSDTKAQYIITKNNRPQRVIINFEDFKKLQNFFNEATANLAAPRQNQTDFAPAETTSQRSLKGLLAERIELSKKSQDTQAAAPEPQENFSLEKIKPFAPEERRLKDEFASTSKAEDDYFSSDEAESLEEIERILPEPPRFERSVARQAAPEPMAPKTESAQKPVEPILEKLPPIVDSKPEVQTRTPEEEEYFKRYRKLYESYVAPTPVVETKTEIKIKNDDASLLASEFELDEEKAEDSHSSSVDLSKKSANPQASRSEVSMSDLRARSWEESLTMNPLSTQDRIEIKEAMPKSEPTPAVAPGFLDDGLPSLHELLQDLEKQKLSGEEDDPLDSDEIEDIIHRITSD
jgi:prevent-host-death family protein